MDMDTAESLNQRSIEMLQARTIVLEAVAISLTAQVSRLAARITSGLFRGGTVAGVAALLLGSQAFAAAPAPSNVIHGCYAVGKNGLPSGNSIRIIKADIQHCATGEATLTWNVRGPIGPIGLIGRQVPTAGRAARRPPTASASSIVRPARTAGRTSSARSVQPAHRARKGLPG